MNNDITGPVDSLVEDVQRLFSQPTATEMSRLTYGLRDLRVGVHEQEARNDFARLLNCGSWLE
jgi:hypothetical protein